jgi:hypothetical protein
VLVILGLLVGGVLSGQSLIRAAEMRAATAQLGQLNAAFRLFQDKYFALPGDMTNATSFWGVRAGTGSDLTCHQTINTTTGTCNGNGNRVISFIAGDSYYGETFAAFQHLAKSGLIEGSYTGATAAPLSYVRLAGINLPAGKISNSMVIISQVSSPTTGDINFFDNTPWGGVMVIKSQADAALITPEEMWNMDTKFDDGLPTKGSVFVYKNTSAGMPNCASDDTVTATYSLTNTSKVCYPFMRIY